MTTTYRKLPGLVEAQQVPDTSMTATFQELSAVAEWAGGKVNMYVATATGQPAMLITIPSYDGPLLAFHGDYIVKDGENISVVKPEVFAQTFVAAE